MAPLGLSSLVMGRGAPAMASCGYLPLCFGPGGDRIPWWGIWASVRGVLDGMALPAPALSVCSHASEALGIDAGVYLGPSHARRVGRLLPEVLVVDHPRWPDKLLACFRDIGHVGHEV